MTHFRQTEEPCGWQIGHGDVMSSASAEDFSQRRLQELPAQAGSDYDDDRPVAGRGCRALVGVVSVPDTLKISMPQFTSVL